MFIFMIKKLFTRVWQKLWFDGFKDIILNFILIIFFIVEKKLLNQLHNFDSVILEFSIF